MARRSELTWRALAGHPLTIAILIYAALVLMNAGLGLKLFLLEPVAWASGEAQVESKPEGLSEEESLAWDVKALKESNARLTQENQLLRELMPQIADFEKAYGTDMPEPIPATILMRAGDSSPWRQGLYLKAGTSQGIEVGNPVCQGRTLVGRISYATANMSIVTLVTDPDFYVPVSILPEKPFDPKLPTAKDLSAGAQPDTPPSYEATTRGMLRGNGSDELRLPRIALEDVAVDTEVKSGMVVVTNPQTGAFPAGLLVGHVEEVQNQNTFLSIRVKSAMDLRLNDVLLVIPHQRPSFDEEVRLITGDRHLEPKVKR